MANERSTQERLDIVNRALEKSQRVRNFEGTPNLDRQLSGLGELPVAEHLNRLLTIGERREAIRIRIDNEAIPKLEKQKLEVESQLVSDSQPESPKTSNTAESTILPEPFDPENPRGLTLVEAAVLAVLINDRIEKGVITDEKDIELFNDDDYKKAYEKIMERRRSLPPINEEDLLAIREEIFSGLAETVRNKKFDDVSEKTEDDNVRTLLLYITVFQSNHTDDILLEKILETKGIAYEVDRSGEAHNFRHLRTIDSSANRVQAPREVQHSVDEEVLGAREQIVEPESELDEELLPEDEVAEAFFRFVPGVLPGEESIEGDHQPAQIDSLSVIDSGIIQAVTEPRNNEPSELPVAKIRDEIAAESGEPLEMELLSSQESEGLPITDEEFEAWYRAQEEVETHNGGEPEIEDHIDQAGRRYEGGDKVFETKASEAIRKALEAGLPETFNLGALLAIHGRGIVRAMDRAIERRLIRVKRIGQSSKPTYGQAQHVLLVYLMENHGDISKREARMLEEMTITEIEKRQEQGQNGGK